jgi:hypothetical protein
MNPMANDASPSVDPRMNARLKAVNTFLAIALLLVLVEVSWQEMRISSLKADVDQSKRDLTTQVEKMANARIQSHREDLVGAVAFVDDLYRSQDGLQRPGGLYLTDAKKVDAEAIGTWILDVYMKARIDGKADADARQAIADAIKGSDEWHRKHPK